VVAQIRVRPDPGIAAESRNSAEITDDDRLGFDLFAIDVWIEIQVHSIDIACAVVGAGHGRQLRGPPVPPIRPVDHIVLAIDADVPMPEVLPVHHAFALGDEGHALAMDKVDLVVDRLRADLCNPADRLD
jgi:hypothetical protein